MCADVLHRYKISDRKLVNPRFPVFENLNMLLIKSAKPYIIAERKRLPPHSQAVEIQTICRKLKTLIRAAMDGAEEQAWLAFNVTLES